MTPSQYAAWISQGSFGAEKASRQQLSNAMHRIRLESEGWDDQTIAQHLEARQRAQNNAGAPREACPARQAYLEWLNNQQ